MSHPISRLKLGFYPLPIEEAHNIRSLLVSSQPYYAMDPCAGDGSAILAITKDTGAHLAAIEIDADRAAACTGEAFRLFMEVPSSAKCHRKHAPFCT